MSVLQVLKINSPTEVGRRQRAVNRIDRESLEIDRIPGAIDGAEHGQCDRRHRRRAGDDRERRRSAGRGPGQIRDRAADLRAIVSQTHRAEREPRASGTRDGGEAGRARIHAGPLKREGRIAIRADIEHRGSTGSGELIKRLRADLRRGAANKANDVQRGERGGEGRAGQIIEEAVGADGRIERADGARVDRVGVERERKGRERSHRLRRRIEHLDELLKAIREEIFADELRREIRHVRIVKCAARDGAAGRESRRMRVGVDRRLKPGSGGKSLEGGPAVIPAREDFVDFFPQKRTDIIDKQPTRAGLKCHRIGIAETQGVDGAVIPRGDVEERIVRRDRAVGINAQNFSHRRRHRLGIGRDIVFAGRKIEFAVRAELDAPAVVPAGGRERGQFKQHELRSGIGDIPGDRETTQAIVARRGGDRIINVKEAVNGEIRIDLDAVQAALLEGGDIERKHRRGQEHVVLDDNHLPALRVDEDAPIGHQAQRRRRGNSADPGLRKSCGQGGLAVDSAGQEHCQSRDPRHHQPQRPTKSKFRTNRVHFNAEDTEKFPVTGPHVFGRVKEISGPLRPGERARTRAKYLPTSGVPRRQITALSPWQTATHGRADLRTNFTTRWPVASATYTAPSRATARSWPSWNCPGPVP